MNNVHMHMFVRSHPRKYMKMLKVPLFFLNVLLQGRPHQGAMWSIVILKL